MLLSRFFQLFHAFRQGFDFDIHSAQGGRMTARSHFSRARPLVELCQERCFHALYVCSKLIEPSVRAAFHLLQVLFQFLVQLVSLRYAELVSAYTSFPARYDHPLNLPRVYPILDTATLQRLSLDPVKAASALLEGGAHILQFRHKTFWSREIFAQAQEIAALCHNAGALFIVNDCADYASLLHAGLHLGQEDLLPADARRVIGPNSIIGFSTHNPDQMCAAQSEPIDYVAFGPVFQTASKERPDPTVGIEGLRTVRALTTKPLAAIGGITRDNAAICWSAGADSVAIIADLFPIPCSSRAIRDRLSEWLSLRCGPMIESIRQNSTSL